MTNNKATPAPVPTTWRDQTVLTISEAAAILRIGRSTAYEAANAGDLPTIQLMTRRVVPVVQLTRLLDGVETAA